MVKYRSNYSVELILYDSCVTGSYAEEVCGPDSGLRNDGAKSTKT